MAKPELGAKHQCQNCATKFFDLNRDPILCPKCGAVFVPLPIARAPARASAAAAAARDEGEVEQETAGVEIVSLDEAEAGEKPEPATDDDTEVDDTPADDNTFLEEEEGDDDVADLIDGEIEDDEEA